MGVKLTKESFEESLKIKNPYKYSKILSIENFKDGGKVILANTIYGKIQAGKDSFYYNKDISILSALDKTSFWVKRSQDTRDDSEYIDYSKVEYKGNKNKIRLRCIKHDYYYKQRPSHHMSGVQGCPYCMKQTIMYSKNNFETHKDFFKDYIGYLYVLKLKSEEEDFYKVGVTAENRLEYRLNQIKKYYKVQVLFLEKGLIEDEYNIEQQFLEELKNYKYKPLKKFGGYTECLTTNPVDEYYNWFYDNYR